MQGITALRIGTWNNQNISNKLNDLEKETENLNVYNICVAEVKKKVAGKEMLTFLERSTKEE